MEACNFRIKRQRHLHGSGIRYNIFGILCNINYAGYSCMARGYGFSTPKKYPQANFPEALPVVVGIINWSVIPTKFVLTPDNAVLPWAYQY